VIADDLLVSPYALPYTLDMDLTPETRRISVSIFGNEKLAEIVLLLEAENG
jgi:hypothetical protein